MSASDISEIRTSQPIAISAKVDTRKRRLLVELNEEVTSTKVPLLRHGLKEIIDSADPGQWDALYFDMRAARLLDSMGVNWLYAESVRIKEAGKTMVIRISSPAIHRVIQFAGLDKIVTLKYRRRKQTR